MGNQLKHLLIILISILLFSLTIYSCSKSSDDGSKSTDTTPPTVSSVYPNDNQTGVSISDNISVTFSEEMDTNSVTVNSSNTCLSGTIQVSSDSFSTCILMTTQPSASNSNKTFSVDPSDNLSLYTTYKIRVTTGVKDSSGNTLSSQYEISFETSSGFKTNISPYVSVGLGGTIITSEDGTTWTERTSGTSTYLGGVSFGNNTFVTVGGSGTILTSSDKGTSWDNRTSGTTKYLQSVSFGNNTFVTVGGSGTILTSSNGISWTSRTSGTSKELTAVTYGNGIFLTVGDLGTIITSSDGITWTARNSGTTRRLFGVTYGNNTFVTVGGWDIGTILTSTDGSTWTTRTSGILITPRVIYGTLVTTGITLARVIYGNSTFVTTGNAGTILTSTDGITWTARTSGTTKHLFGVTYGNNTFVTTGQSGTVLTSSDGISWDKRTSGISNTQLGLTTYSIPP